MGCPQLGLDPRLLADRGSGADRAHLVGIWDPYTTVRVQALFGQDHEGTSTIPIAVVDPAKEGEEECPKGLEQDHAAETTNEPPQATDTQVIFATRYLIAQESRSS